MKTLPWWKDSKKWKPGYWYPGSTSGDIEFKGEEMTVEATEWDLYRLDPEIPIGDPMYGDIDGMGLDVDFYTAVKIANAVNSEQLWTATWLPEKDQVRMVGGKPIEKNVSSTQRDE